MSTIKMENLHGYLVGRTAFTMKHRVHKLFKLRGYSTTPEHWAILNLLEQEQGITQRELAEKTVKDKANITRILDVMQRNGLIQRRKHENDRRAYKIFLTDKGRKLHYELSQYVQEIDTKASAGLKADELVELRRILTRMADNLHE